MSTFDIYFFEYEKFRLYDATDDVPFPGIIGYDNQGVRTCVPYTSIRYYEYAEDDRAAKSEEQET